MVWQAFLNLNERQIMATLTATDLTIVEQLMEVEGKAEIVNGRVGELRNTLWLEMTPATLARRFTFR